MTANSEKERLLSLLQLGDYSVLFPICHILKRSPDPSITLKLIPFYFELEEKVFKEGRDNRNDLDLLSTLNVLFFANLKNLFFNYPAELTLISTSNRSPFLNSYSLTIPYRYNQVNKEIEYTSEIMLLPSYDAPSELPKCKLRIGSIYLEYHTTWYRVHTYHSFIKIEGRLFWDLYKEGKVSISSNL